MADWVVGPVMEKLIDAGFEYLKDQVRWQTGMKEELQRLRVIHPKIQAVVFAANQPQIGDQNPAFNKWLWQLRDAIDEADDVLDEFQYMKHQQQITKTKKQIKVRSIMKSIKKRLVKIGKRALKVDPNLKRLEEVVQKLVNISTDVGNFLHLFENMKLEQHEQQLELYNTRETGSLPKNDLIGRYEEMEFIMQWLTKTSYEHETHITGTTFYNNISLLSIVGLGGMGKTTLLQHVYEDKMTKEFELKMWVCVSTNFNVKRVIADILESLKKNKCDLQSLDALQGSLKFEVTSKKFLLVLDDIWEEEKDKSKWEDVLAPLAYGSLGSKILVTTRMDSVALMIAKVLNKKEGDKILRLGGLKEDDCLQLLTNHAFANIENPDGHKKSIAGQIVKKVLGSPLVAKVIGGVLNSNMDKRHWIKVLNSDIGSLEQSQNIFLPILRLSYTFLPKPLRSCFLFCSIFPQDHVFDKNDLIRMWIALGFIQPSSNPEETLEDVAENYFDILVKKSFFDKFHDMHKSYYKMHDLLHELAQFVSAQECFRVIDGKVLSIPETIRHLSVETKNLEVLRKIKKFKNLRSLLLFCDVDNDVDNDQDFVDVISKIFEASRSIRLLFIHAPCRIPEEIEYLIHLRYLKFDDNYGVTPLPRSISNLYHLQFIIYDSELCTLSNDFLLRDSSNSFPDDFLPRDINNLFNLRYLGLPWEIFSGIHGIGKLYFLQKLNGFFVKEETDYRIEELKHMNELRQLSIYHLENVKDAEEACSAKFCHKSNLEELSLYWGDNEGNRNLINPNIDEKVFDNLQPHSSLKQLTIYSFMGIRSAMWMNNANLMSNLECIQLSECLEWQTLPPFGQLPFLKFLYLYNMPKAKSIDYKFHKSDKNCVFPSLEVLHIVNLEALEDWFDAAAAAAADDCLFPCLTELRLIDCPNLQVLTSSPPKLQELVMVNIGWKAFSWLNDTGNCCKIHIQECGDFTYLKVSQGLETTTYGHLIHSKLNINDPSMLLMEPLKSITSLEKLIIEKNDELVLFSIEAEQWFLQISSSLCELAFTYLQSLQSLPFSLESLSSLKILCVEMVCKLQLLPKIPTSLEHLYLLRLKSLQCLPSFLPFSSLECLQLVSIPLLKLLPDLPPSLCKLYLYELENLGCLPSYFHRLCSLRELRIRKVPQLRELPDLPPSLFELILNSLENLNCLPSCLPSLYSLQKLVINMSPQLRELPDFPPSLRELHLIDLNNLNCLPSSLCSLSSLQKFFIDSTPIQELPDMPPSLQFLSIKNCHPKLMERYKKFSGSDWHKIAHIPTVDIPGDQFDPIY